MSASDLKNQGNKLFSAGQYAEAIECYSKATGKEPGEPKYICNRALCYLRLQRWQEAAADCRKALELNRSYAKAHFFLGEALVALEQYNEGISAMTRASELAQEQNLFFGDDIARNVREARRKRWTAREDRRLQETSELERFFNQLVEERRNRQLQDLERSGGTPSGASELIDAECEHRKEQIAELFAQADQTRKRREVPDVLCGKISFELMRDPCITPSGITYERSSIEEHLQRVGHFDPITRQKLTSEQLIPNLAMKEVIDAFVEENGWVEDY